MFITVYTGASQQCASEQCKVNTLILLALIRAENLKLYSEQILACLVHIMNVQRAMCSIRSMCNCHEP